MALVVEDGTGLSTAESYASIATASAYLDVHHASGTANAFTAAATSAQEIALRVASDYLHLRYAKKWRGSRIVSTMTLDWPRDGVSDDDGYEVVSTSVPTAIENATAEMALRFIDDSAGHGTSRLLPDVKGPVGSITYKRSKADTSETEVHYGGGADQQKLYAGIDRMVSHLVLPSGAVQLA